MFSNLFNLGYTRTLGQAVVFYIVYFIIFLLVSMILSIATGIGIFGITDPAQNFLWGQQTTKILGVVFCLGLGFAILIKKNLQGDSMSLVLVVVAGAIAYFSAPLFGLIPVAFLTTKK